MTSDYRVRIGTEAQALIPNKGYDRPPSGNPILEHRDEHDHERLGLIVRYIAVLVLALFLAPNGVHAVEAPKNMKRFNVTCPAKKLLPTLKTAYRGCQAGGELDCARFVRVLRELLPVYDCQRPFDTTPTNNYIVPAVWLAGGEDVERYFQLLSELAGRDAAQLFGSNQFRSALDGYLAERFRLRSEEVERSLRLQKTQQPNSSVQPPDAGDSGR